MNVRRNCIRGTRRCHTGECVATSTSSTKSTRCPKGTSKCADDVCHPTAAKTNTSVSPKTRAAAQAPKAAKTQRTQKTQRTHQGACNQCKTRNQSTERLVSAILTNDHVGCLKRAMDYPPARASHAALVAASIAETARNESTHAPPCPELKHTRMMRHKKTEKTEKTENAKKARALLQRQNKAKAKTANI
jgi:hypothetical protein